MISRYRLAPLCLAVAAASFSLSACKPKAPAGGGKRPVVPVVVTEAGRKDMPVVVRAIGRVTSPATVSIKPQVTGTISEVHFADGQMVKKGDPLITIDKRPFEVALEQARASQAEADTRAANAQDQARRYSSLDKTGSVSKEQVADFQATAKAAQSAVQVAAAAVKSAELQLEYCSIRAPIEGRAGKALVTAGNVVSANQTDLVVVNQLAPVEVTFSVAEQHLVSLQKALAAGTPKVTARMQGRERRTTEGELVFLDNNVRAASGTIELKAAFKNEDQLLWPGQFVGLRVQVAVDEKAVVVPAAAVQNGPDSAFVYLVKPDKTAEMRKIVVARTSDEESVVSEGLQGGEQVVVDGQSRIGPGSAVELVKPIMDSSTGEPTRPAPVVVEDKEAAKS